MSDDATLERLLARHGRTYADELGIPLHRAGPRRAVPDAGRRAADEHPHQRRHRGRVGADVFCREVQVVWAELRPFVDDPALQVADDLGLARTPQELADLAGEDELSEVAAAPVRCGLAKRRRGGP